MVDHGLAGHISAVVAVLEGKRAGSDIRQDSEIATSTLVGARGVGLSVVHVGLFVSGCLLRVRGGWTALALGDLDHPLAVDIDGCDLYQPNVYERKIMTMRQLRRRLKVDAVFRASTKSNDKKHQRKFMSRMEKWAIDIREAIANKRVLDVDSSGNVSVGGL